MNSDFGTERGGEQLGIDTVDRAVAIAEAYCDCESQRITLTNQPKIIALEAELSIHAEEVDGLEARLRRAEPPGGQRGRMQRALYYWSIALLLTVASFFFSMIAFEPYQLGWKGWLYCIGVAVVTPFCLDKVLEAWECRRLIKALTTAAAIAALSSLIVLAVIRGDVLAQQIEQTQTPSVEIDADTPSPTQALNSFYQETLALLRLAMALLAVAMELGSGIALNEARQISSSSGEDFEALAERRRQVQQQMVSLLYESKVLSNEPGVFRSQFWRNFYRAMLTHTLRSGLRRLLILVLFVPLLCRAQTPTPKQLSLVVAIDLSTSVAAQGHEGKTEFEKNVTAISRLLERVPPASRVTVIGITENSFAQPYILLSARVAGDPGYFGEKIAGARQQLTHAWQQRSSHLEPKSHGTDILGALLVASQIFQQASAGEDKVLMLFSDMRQFTRQLNLESHADMPPGYALARIEKGRLIANLSDVRVYVLGADSAGKEVRDWQGAQQFWTAYFNKSGAILKNYSILRELPNFRP